MSDLKFETAVAINAPIEKVYSYVADFPRHVQWNHQPEVMTPLNGGESAVGNKFRTEETAPSNMGFMQKMMMMVMMPVLKRKHNYEGYTLAEITALDLNKRVAWSSHLPDREGKKLLEMHWELQLQEKGGGTQVTQLCHVDPPADSPFTSFVNVPDIKEEATTNLIQLKSLLEA